MTQGEEFQEQIGRIEGLVQEIESSADPALRATAKELVQSVLALHRAGIERILEMVCRAGEAGATIVGSLATDDLVSSLLVLYDLHPEDFSTRVRRGVENAQQRLSRHGAALAVLALGNQTVHLRIEASGHTCASTTAQLESVVRGALLETAPDATEVLIDSALEQQASGFVPLDSLRLTNGSGATRISSRP
jgi:flagellar biosynthesis/type III secretory pathway protein FliH